MKPAAALAAAALATLTSGCVAALPLAAGAALARRHAELERPATKPVAGADAIAEAAEPRVVPTALTVLPRPAPANSTGDPDIEAFATFATEQNKAPSPGGNRFSAILPRANELRVARTACQSLPAAVIVDLDPGRGTFDPLMPGTADPALGGALARLRAQGITVAWLSRLGSNFEAATRESLARTGLDPAGADTLLLLHDIAERKQSLRDQIAKRHCPVAMLGDERADFDELYLYLKNPDGALALDAMIGKGWFLASPFARPDERDPVQSLIATGSTPDRP